jgi:hypothetical protein
MNGLVVLALMLAASFGAGYLLRAQISRRRKARYLKRLAYRQAFGLPNPTRAPRTQNSGVTSTPAVLSNLTPPGRPQSPVAEVSPMRPSMRLTGDQRMRSTAR